MKIAHISDIHAGRSWMFDSDLLARAIGMINVSDAEAVLITGDVTDWGIESEYKEALSHIELITKETHIVPGNHDARIAGYKLFKQYFCKKRERFFTRAFDEVLLIGLDSSEPDIDDGHIGREQLDWLDKTLARNANERVPVVALHHHLVPVPNTGRERNILVDAGDVLEVIDRHKVPLVVTGHKHNPWLWRLDDTFVYSGGTVSCRRTAVANAMSFIDIDGKGIRITKVVLPSGSEETVVEHRW